MRAALAIGAVALVAACEPAPAPAAGTSDAGASPNASILPAPLVTEAPDLGGPQGADASAPEGDGGILGLPLDASGRPIVPDAGAPPPEALRPEAPIAAESPSSREVAGVSLDAVFRWRDVPQPPKAPEVAGEGIREAQRLTALSWKVDLSESGRMRVEFTSRALPLPTHAELRARSDRFGHLVLWPNAGEYRVVPPGALRTVIGERRVDVTPLAAAAPKAQGEGRRLGLAVRKVELASNHGTVRLELARVPEAGEGGALFCRALVEIGGVDPRTPACQPGEVPLAASWSWSEGGGVALEVGAISKRTDLAANSLLTPPPGAAYAPSGLPAVPHGIFLSRDELAAFRTGPIPLPPSTDAAAPGEGFIAENRGDTLAYLLVDGVPVVAVPPLSERYVIGPPRGRYVVQWRTFLGERVSPPQTVTMPARLVHGGALDAGAPDAGAP